MRIIYLHQYYNSLEMSGGTRSAEMARRFAAAGHDVQIVSSDRSVAPGAVGAWTTTREDGYTVHWCKVPYDNKMAYTARVTAFLQFAWRAGTRAVALGGDVVFASSTPLTIAVPGIRSARRLGCPFVFEVRDLWPELPIAMGALPDPFSRAGARLLERWAYRNSSEIVALSPGMRDGVIRGGGDPEHVTVVPNACDVDLYGPAASGMGAGIRGRYPWLGSRPIILYAGTIGKINGVEYLARVAAAATDPHLRFVVVGSGGEEARVRQIAAELGVLDVNFFLLPPVPKRDVAAWFDAASVCTSLFIPRPEMEVNSANKFFDGLAAGRPIAINYGGWQADLLRDSGAGVALPSDDPALAARMLSAMVADPVRVASMGKAARVLAETRFSRDRLAADLLSVLQRAVTTRRR